MGSSLFADLMPILGSAVGGYYGGSTGALVGGDIGSSVGGAMTSQQAAQAEQNAANQALQFEQGVYGNTQNQIAPYQYAGNAALSKMMGLLGLGGLPMGGYGGYGGYGGNPATKTYGPGPMGQTAIQGNAPVGGGMPNRGMGAGYAAPINYGAGNAFSVNTPQGFGSDTGSPTTLTLGGQQTTGAPTSNWEQALATGAGYALAGPMGGVLANRIAGSNAPDVSFGGQSVNTNINKTNLKPTGITVPTSTMTVPGLIMDPKTGGYVGQAYYSTPVGAARENELNAGMGQFLGGQDRNMAATYQFRQGHQRLTGGEVHGGLGGDSYVVGEKGRSEILHLAPGSVGYVEPNPKTVKEMKSKLPGRLLGGPVGQEVFNRNAPMSGAGHSFGGFTAPATTAPMIAGTGGPHTGALGGNGYGFSGDFTGRVTRPSGMVSGSNFGNPAYFNPAMTHPANQGAFPQANQGMLNSVNSQMPGTITSGANTTPGGPSAGFNLGTGAGAASGPAGGGATTPATSGSSQGGFNPWASNTQAQMTGGQTPSDILSQDPSYQFRFQQGLQALQNSAIARGTGLSGGYMRGAEEFGSGLASQEFGNIYSRLAALSGSGLSSTGIGSQAGVGLAFPYGMASMYGGSAGAQGALGSYGALSQGLGNLSFLYGQNSVPSYGGNTSYTPTTTSGGAGSWNSYNPGMYGSGSDWGSQWLNTGGG